MRTLAPPPDNPFNDPDPHTLLGRAIRLPFQIAVVAITLLAFGIYILLGLGDDSES